MARKSNHSGPKYANGNYKSYQKKYDSSALQIKKRAKLNAKNREAGTYGNGDGKKVNVQLLTKRIVNLAPTVTATVKMLPTPKVVKHVS